MCLCISERSYNIAKHEEHRVLLCREGSYSDLGCEDVRESTSTACDETISERIYTDIKRQPISLSIHKVTQAETTQLTTVKKVHYGALATTLRTDDGDHSDRFLRVSGDSVDIELTEAHNRP